MINIECKIKAIMLI